MNQSGRPESLTKNSRPPISRRKALQNVLFATGGGFIWGACGRTEVTEPSRLSTKIRVGMEGITCEAPLFVAVEKGFFHEEGLEPEVVRFDSQNFKDALSFGRCDITQNLIMFLL